MPDENDAPTLGFPSSKKITHTKPHLYAAILVGGIIVGVLLADTLPQRGNRASNSAAVAKVQEATTTPTSAAVPAKPSPTAVPLVVDDQKAGPSVSVSELSIARPTWVVVFVSREGKPGNALGARLFFASDKKGSVGLLRNTQAGQSYFVGLSVDDGDRAFNLAKDKPVADADGGPLWETFRAL